MELTYSLSNPHLERRRWWAGLAAGTNQTDPFCCSAAWQFAFHDACRPERRLLIEEDSGSVIAFAEEAVSTELIYLTPLESHWFFGSPLLGRHCVELLSEAMGFFEKAYAPAFPRVVIGGLRPEGSLPMRLYETFSDKFRIFLAGGGVQSAASLTGGLDGFLSRRSSKWRAKLRREARRAAENGITFERLAPASPQEAEAAFGRILAVELTSWKGIDNCGMAESPVKQFYALLLNHLAATGEGRMTFARRAGKDIGFIFGALAGKIYRGQQFSYDRDWKDFSVGNLLQLEQIRWLCEQGVTRYDLGPLDGPRMEYKRHWAEQEIEAQIWMLEKK